MRNTILVGIGLAFISLANMAQAEESATYFVAQVEITDQETYFNSYGAKVAPQLQAVGAEILAASPNSTVLEGEWPGNWTVVIKFPSQEAALAWYQTDAYQKEIRPIRLQSASLNNLILVPSFAPPQ